MKPATTLAATLADLADLPLATERAVIAGDLLAAWLAAANELSRKMSAPEYADLLPVTVFSHAARDADA